MVKSSYNRWKPWTQKEDDFLRENKNIETPALAEALGRTTTSINNRFHTLGIRRGYKHWLVEEDEYLVDNYSTMTNKEIGKKLDRTWSSVQQRAAKLGLSKKPIVVEVDKERLAEFREQAKNFIEGDELALDPFEFEYFMEILNKCVRGV